VGKSGRVASGEFGSVAVAADSLSGGAGVWVRATSERATRELLLRLLRKTVSAASALPCVACDTRTYQPSQARSVMAALRSRREKQRGSGREATSGKNVDGHTAWTYYSPQGAYPGPPQRTRGRTGR
jgi:hypothetical protein